MTNQQFNQLVTLLKAALNQPNNAPKPKASSYKAANKFEPKGSGSKSARSLQNEVAVAKAFAKQGVSVIPRETALSYKGWLAKGLRVKSGEKGTFVKGVGTMFHRGQVDLDKELSSSFPA